MEKDKLLVYLNDLEINKATLSKYMSINPRSVSRWIKLNDIPRIVECTLKAWKSLKDNGYEWRPNYISFNELDLYDFQKYLFEKIIDPNYIIQKVEDRNGPSFNFKVKLNFTSGTANFGPIKIAFKPDKNNYFIPLTYGRLDQNPDLIRDIQILEDAFYCIIKEIDKKGWPKI